MSKIKTAVIATVIAAAGIGVAAPANADADTYGVAATGNAPDVDAYVHWMDKLGFRNEDGIEAEIHNGFVICKALGWGFNHESVADYVQQHSVNLTYTDAMRMIQVAETTLC